MALAGSLAVASSMPAQAQILPSGGTVAAGSASIVSVNPASTVIVQQSQKAIINWQSFSVGAGATVSFQQPGSAAITLNRVTGTGVSAIDGNLRANGQIWLVNGNGILMGQGSRVDVGGLIATTSDIADGDFLSGRYAFGRASGNPDAAVINRGSIKAATGGSAVLSGAHVANEGLIQARLGHVVLGGANAFSVSFDGDNLVQYQVTAPVSETPRDADGNPAAALVSNSGTIAAQGGQVLMTARAARNVVDNVINTTGIIQAQSALVRNGEVVLDAGEGGAVAAGGTVDVSGRQAGKSGGTVTLLGDKVAVADGARLDASGDSGGGKILIGGDLHATGAQPSAQSVAVGKAVIAADATSSGKGGTVAIVSSGKTSVAAVISAKGIDAGGMVETSGHDLTIAEGARVDTSAAAGATGLWLLDPVDVDIDSAAAANIVASIASTNVSVTASNDITVDASINYTSANSLTFLAGRNLTVNAGVQNSGSGDILAVAGWDGLTAASGILTTPGSYGNGGGNILINSSFASDGVSLGSRNGATNVAAHDLTLSARNSYVQLGYHDAPSVSVLAQGSIDVALSGRLALIGGDTTLSSFAQIGHGGPETAGVMSGAISITAQGPINLSSGAGLYDYAQIGHGGGNSVASTSGKVLLVSAGNITLGARSIISAGGTGDTIVLAAAGDFSNQAGSAAFDVSAGGRWLVFLNSPANNVPGALNGLPFYNRAFDFSADSYAPVASAGNRFVYALAPVVTVTANSASKTYGNANPAFSATISGGLASDAAAGIFTGSPSLGTPATASSAVGSYPILASLGTLASDYNYSFQFVNGALQINPATLTAALTGTVRKTFDGTAIAPVSAANYTLAGLVAGDSVALSSVAAYSDKNAGTGKTVTASGLVLSGAASGNYVLASSSISAAIGIIDSATLAAALTGTVRKIYDGTTAATLSAANYTLAGLVAGDSVSLNNPAAAAYGDKNAGTGKIVVASGLALSGTDKGNYVLASSNISAAIGIIDPAGVTASLTGTVQKAFDGTDAATLDASNYALTGIVSGDNVTLNYPVAGAFDSKNGGTGKIVTVTGLTLLGADKSNYVLASPTVNGPIGIITVAPLDVLGNSFTSNGVSLSAPGQFPSPAGGNGAAKGPSDATSDTGTDGDTAQSDSAALSLGKSLSGGAQSSSSVLLEGLLRQVTPSPGGPTRSVPPYGQIFSSWGNEAFWQ
jgi:filamentous hemagglutinin family protein